jgi:hypothetical protein
MKNRFFCDDEEKKKKRFKRRTESQTHANTCEYTREKPQRAEVSSLVVVLKESHRGGGGGNRKECERVLECEERDFFSSAFSTNKSLSHTEQRRQ